MANRKQARALAKRAKVKTSEARQILQSEGLAATRRAVDDYTIAVAMILWDEGRHDKEQLATTMKKVNKLFEEINSGEVSIEDCQKTLDEEADFIIK